MNIFRGTSIPKRLQTSEHLAGTLHTLANDLSVNRWNQRRIQDVHLTRSITEEVGEESYYKGEVIDPIFTSVSISFTGLKRMSEQTGLIVPKYTVSSTVSQEIEKKEIPEAVLDEIFDVNEENDSHDVVGDEVIDWTNDNLDELELKRVQDVEYSIDEDGLIGEYAVNYSYTFDDEIVHEVGFNSSYEQYFWRPVYVHGGYSFEKRPVDLKALNDEAIRSDVLGIDTELESFLIKETVKDIAEYSSLSHKQHIQQVLGILGLVSDGFKNPRK